MESSLSRRGNDDDREEDGLVFKRRRYLRYVRKRVQVVYYCPMYPLVTPMSSINAGTPTIPTIPMIAIGSFSGFVPAFSSGDKNASVFASFARVIFFGASP